MKVSKLSGKESAWNAGDLGLIPGLGRSPGGGHGNPLQYSCLENPMDRGAWQAAVRGVTQSQTQLKWLNSSKQNWNPLSFCYYCKELEHWKRGCYNSKALDGVHPLTSLFRILPILKAENLRNYRSSLQLSLIIRCRNISPDCGWIFSSLTWY